MSRKNSITLRPGYNKKKLSTRIFNMRHYYVLLLPVVVYFAIFHYWPMYGVQIAFKDYTFAGGIMGSPWVGFKHFQRMFTTVAFMDSVRNTIILSLMRLVIAFPAPIIFALLLNELRSMKFKRTVQTISYLPYFISWVILGGILREVLSPSRGIINYIIQLFGGQPVHFLAETSWFRWILVISGIWQSVGYGAIIYLAAIAGIPTEQYEAARIDGANRLQMALRITLPSLAPTIVIMFIMALGGILNGGFDQVFNLTNAAVTKVADIIDTYVYRAGLVDFQYSFSAAVGLFKNVIGFVLVLGSDRIIRKISGGEYGLW